MRERSFTLTNWAKSFFSGQRLQAEIQLLAKSAIEPNLDLSADFALIHQSYGSVVDGDDSNHQHIDHSSDVGSLSYCYELYKQSANDAPGRRSSVWKLSDMPDSLLLHCLQDLLSSTKSSSKRQELFLRLGDLLSRRFPSRPDLILQLIAFENAFSVLKSLPDRQHPASAFYRNNQCCIYHLHSLWVKGRYEQLVRDYCHYCFQARWFPLSDFLLRSYTILGLSERVSALFRNVYNKYHSQLSLVTVSNMLFIELGREVLDIDHVSCLIADFRRLSDLNLPSQIRQEHQNIFPRRLHVNEKRLLAVVSPDLRHHPVGRFWLPIASRLYQDYTLVHVALNAGPDDVTRNKLKQTSHHWQDFSCNDDPSAFLKDLRPDALIDLGGHTADNRPGLLNQRIAPLQVTYLGFYGPSFASHCDWWILDNAIAARISDTYPRAESVWSLPCPSLCYDPDLHGLPSLSELKYSEPSHPVLGSFNHSRKLTDSCLKRFAAVISSVPDATFLFRSHSFYDKQVRRWFLDRLIQAGLSPEQLLAIPYAITPSEGYRDYGRLHLHLDSYPVCGTTTTLDSLAMGIPVLTCPNHLYAGAISAALLEHLGFNDWIAEEPSQLTEKASMLLNRYQTAEARFQLANEIRSSPLCDKNIIPCIFSNQLLEMFKFV